MKNKIIIGLALVLTPAFLLTSRHLNAPDKPAALRDAVADTLQPNAGKAAAIPEPGTPQASGKEAKLSPLGGLTLKMVAVKAKMERAELSLWEVSRILENKEGGSLDRVLQTFMKDLKACTAASKEFSAQAGDALAKTRKTPDTLATGKLLLANIAEYTDNDETIILIRLGHITKEYPDSKSKIQPHIDEYLKSLEALGKAGSKVSAFSGLLESE